MKIKKKAAPGLSPQAQVAWDQLDQKTKSTIQKDNPLKMARNRAIYELIVGQGLKYDIVEELSGLNRATIYRILGKGEGYLPLYAKKEIKELVRSFQKFIDTLCVVLDDGFKNRRERR